MGPCSCNLVLTLIVMWILLCLYFIACCTYLISPPVAAKSFMLFGKVELDHFYFFIRRELMHRKQLTHPMLAVKIGS